MSKIDELKFLALKLKMDNILIKMEDVALKIEDKGDLVNTFPVPNCETCTEKCCPPRVMISLFDLANFIDRGFDDYVAGMFKGYVELYLSDEDEKIDISRPHMFPPDPDAKECVFMDENQRCSIYEYRPQICRSFPLAVRIDEDKTRIAIWMGGCKNYEISSDKYKFINLLENAIQDYNEKVTSNALMMNKRTELREFGYGKYMEDELILLRDYKNKIKDLQTETDDLKRVVERLREPQDQVAMVQNYQEDNQWLKERLVNMEKELSQQRENAHKIISELTEQLSEQRKLIEKINQEQYKKSRWLR
ncbi:hypothetical protein GF312_03060 [Candidatus Poribacteria bacterium]|nr:hypothetical protein [Candidatus Poribacteria bacterium]